VKTAKDIEGKRNVLVPTKKFYVAMNFPSNETSLQTSEKSTLNTLARIGRKPIKAKLRPKDTKKGCFFHIQIARNLYNNI